LARRWQLEHRRHCCIGANSLSRHKLSFKKLPSGVTGEVKNGPKGDQIRQISVHWVTVFVVQFFENYKRSPNFWLLSIYGKGDELILTKTGLGNTLGDSFTYSSVTLTGNNDFSLMSAWPCGLRLWGLES
jgi:hypothetical protein